MSIRDILPAEEFRNCDNCNYDRGFHTSFLKDDVRYRVILICPEWSTRYDVGRKIDL
ncbi:hypothetical protein ACFL0D_00640 [Thermoproteota archaeon]